MQDLIQQCIKCSHSFSTSVGEISLFEKMKIPVLKVCPECRFKMKALWRNETTLYSGQKCDMCEKNIITMFNPQSSHTIYCFDCYYSDKWNPEDYKMDYEMTRPFFDQLKELVLKVPKPQMSRTVGIGPNINSDYSNCSGGIKNCYMTSNTGNSEDCLFSRGLKDCVETCDAYYGVKMDQCYEVVNTQQSSKLTYSKNAVGCVDSHFLLNCSGCTDCFGCVNIRNKSYCWYNEQLTKEEYQSNIQEVIGSYEQIEYHKSKFYDHALSFPMRATSNVKAIESTGDYLFETKNVHNSMEITSAEDSYHMYSSKLIKDSSGTIGFGYNAEMLVECVASGTSSRLIGCLTIDDSKDLAYCLYVRSNSSDLFGCDSLKGKKYCILNKQYSKEEYEALKNHIVKELIDMGIYGLMIPEDLAPFAYNECIAQDNFPLTKEVAVSLGYRWEDGIQITKGKETLKPEEVPDNIKDVPDTIKNEILKCVSCERNYKIIEQELVFYCKMNLPIPRKCFYCRHRGRIALRGPYKFWDRTCAHCSKSIKTNYSPERPEIVYCEDCYRSEVI
jgi:hypothetical protein